MNGFFIIIRGPLGCGKSTIAQLLAKKLNAKYVAVDSILEKYNLTKDKEQGYISQKSFMKANTIISPKVEITLQSGIPIVFDGNFYWKSQIDDLIQRLDFPHFVFTLKAPLDVCLKRDRKRGKSYGEDAVRAVYNKSTEFDYGFIIDVTKQVDECVQEILLYL